MVKNQFRKICKEKLIKKSKKFTLFEEKFLNHFLDKFIQKMDFKQILLYHPLAIEVNLNELAKNLKRNKKRKIYAPFMEGKSFKVVQFRLALKKGKFGIYQNSRGFYQPRELDLLIIPIIGVDRNFKRIGFGKGMYDRFFAKLHKKPIVVFIQKELCFSNRVITNSYDIKADIILTPKKIMVKRGFLYVNRVDNRYFYYNNKRSCRLLIG